MQKGRAAKICPQCGSPNIVSLFWLGDIYECRNCGYRGPIVIKRLRRSRSC